LEVGLVLEAVARDVADVDEAVLIGDGRVGAVGAKLSGDRSRFLGGVVDDDGVGDCEVETEIFYVAWRMLVDIYNNTAPLTIIGLELMQALVELFI
jgi:hypothetical protein